MHDIKIRKIGNSLGVVIPREVLDRLHLDDGDHVFLTETPDGYKITPHAPEFKKQIEIAEKGMARYRNTLRALAK